MFTSVKLFFKLVARDAKVYGRERPSTSFYIAALLGLSRFSAVFLYRVNSSLYNKGFPWSALAKLVNRANTLWNGSEIFPEAKIGPGFHLPHPTGVVIGAITAGCNFRVYQNATLGVKDESFDYNDFRNYPCLGDNVIVGANATVLGSVIIGDDVVIGANAVVLTDIPAGCRAVGNPARILPGRTMTARRTLSLQA